MKFSIFTALPIIMKDLVLTALLAFLTLQPARAQQDYVYSSDILHIELVKPGVYRHISYLSTESYGKVECNGMIIIEDDEAIVIDTPVDDESSEELIKFIEGEFQALIKAIIPTHFHLDCLGGLAAFHGRNIPSYANNKTIALAYETNEVIPQNGFDNLLELSVGNEKVVLEYLGKGHTEDNIIVHYPRQKVLFGGCFIKSLGAGKGNLEDADVYQWPETVKKVKAKYPDTELVIPGHGKPGDVELLDYTIKLFTDKNN